MRNDLFLKSDVAKNLYDAVRDLPIVDYHCHLSPKEILEDREFPDIAQIWLGGDHYKWRLMRACGVPEALITGDAEPREKFRAWAACLETAMGNPLYVWSHMELSMFFGIEDTLTAESADDIFDRANAYIKEHHLSPRKLMLQSHVELVETTDDPADSLEYHKEIAKEKNFPVRVVPSFRTDAALNICRANYRDYALHLGEVCGFSVETLDDLKTALSKRLDFFCENGCRVSDIGIEGFPKEDKSCDAAETYKKALLDTMDRRDSLPHTILYTLEPSMYMALATTAGSFKGVVPGAAWWFCDHKRGMEEQLNIMAETGHLGQFTGMLTDSRSFLSYARHDYFRRVLCNRVAEELMDGTFLSEKAALKLLTDLCVENSRKLFGE